MFFAPDPLSSQESSASPKLFGCRCNARSFPRRAGHSHEENEKDDRETDAEVLAGPALSEYDRSVSAKIIHPI
jgi:hypothetical protein